MMDILVPMILGNQWLWAHIGGGVIVGKIMSIECVKNRFKITLRKAFIYCLAGAILWEIGEGLFTDIDLIYSSRLNFILDSIGDIIGAVLFCVITFI